MIYLWICNGTRDLPINSKITDTRPHPITITLWSLNYFVLSSSGVVRPDRIKQLHTREIGSTNERRMNGRMLFQEVIRPPHQVETRYTMFVWELMEATTKQQRQRY